MKLDDITAIRQTSDEKEVNECLAKGYRIVKIFSGKIPGPGQEMIILPIFILGINEGEKR